jgi:hypothetical protein
VATSFAVQTAQRLQPDYEQATLSLLEQFLLPQGIQASNTTMASNRHSNAGFVPQTVDVWINGLWFTSITLSLTTSLLAVLAKQWLNALASIPAGNSRDRARVRQFRSTGMKTWCLPSILALLPFPLHAAVGLFIAGLVIFLWSLNFVIALVSAIVASITFVFYWTTIFLPLLFPTCPYKTPLALHIHDAYRLLSSQFNTGIRFIRTVVQRFRFNSVSEASSFEPFSRPLPRMLYLARERAVTEGMGLELDVQALSELYSSTSNYGVKKIIIQSIGGFPVAEGLSEYMHSIQPMFRQDIRRMWEVATTGRRDGEELERLLRASFQLDVSLQSEPITAMLPKAVSDEWKTLTPLLPWMTTHDHDTENFANLFFSYLCGDQLDVRLHPVIWCRFVGNSSLTKPYRSQLYYSHHVPISLHLLSLLQQSSFFTSEGMPDRLCGGKVDVIDEDKPFTETLAMTLSEAIMGCRTLQDQAFAYLQSLFNVPTPSSPCSPQVLRLALLSTIIGRCCKLKDVRSQDASTLRLQLSSASIKCFHIVTYAEASKGWAFPEARESCQHSWRTLHDFIASDIFLEAAFESQSKWLALEAFSKVDVHLDSLKDVERNRSCSSKFQRHLLGLLLPPIRCSNVSFFTSDLSLAEGYFFATTASKILLKCLHPCSDVDSGSTLSAFHSKDFFVTLTDLLCDDARSPRQVDQYYLSCIDSVVNAYSRILVATSKSLQDASDKMEKADFLALITVLAFFNRKEKLMDLLKTAAFAPLQTQAFGHLSNISTNVRFLRLQEHYFFVRKTEPWTDELIKNIVTSCQLITESGQEVI